MRSQARAHGIFSLDDLRSMRSVFGRITAEPWFDRDPDRQEEFAAFVIHAFERSDGAAGLELICRNAAADRFESHSDTGVSVRGRRFLIVEDDYFIASEAANRLQQLGAEILGPVGDVSGAFDLIERSDAQIDAAILDINLAGQTVYPVAAFLAMKHVPVAFVTGYVDRTVPQFHLSTLTFSKPADWGTIAHQLVQTNRPRPIFPT